MTYAMTYADGWTDRQVPAGQEIFIDHTAHFVADLDLAATALQRIGFRVSRMNLQQNRGADGVERPSGTSNRLVRLRRGFLEFLAATHPTPLADQLKTGLARYPGLHLIAFSNADLASARTRLGAAGFAMQELLEMRRKALEPGASGTVGWKILRTEPGEMAEGRIQFVYPETPALSWPTGADAHPNAADALTGVLIVVADAAEAEARYARFLGRPATDGCFRTERGRLRIVGANAPGLPPGVSPPTLPFIAAISIASRDLAQTRRVLKGTPADDRDGAVWLGRGAGLGACICFHDPATTPF